MPNVNTAAKQASKPASFLHSYSIMHIIQRRQGRAASVAPTTTIVIVIVVRRTTDTAQRLDARGRMTARSHVFATAQRPG
jgi:hypothetical protein